MPASYSAFSSRPQGKDANNPPCSPPAPLRAEIIGDDIAMAAGITARGHAPILRLCRLLVAAEFNPATSLEAYRGATLCLRVRSLGEAAGLTVRESMRDGRPRFATLSSDVGPPVHQNEIGLVSTREAAELLISSLDAKDD
jgi:hypothetical protein